MSSDPERFLERLTPRGAPSPLRERVLEAVAQELAAHPSAGRGRWIGAALAAAVLLGVGLNLGLDRLYEARVAALYGPRLPPRPLVEMTRTIEATTDGATASWFQREWLATMRPHPVAPMGQEKYWIDYYSGTLGKDESHDEASEEPENRRDHRRGARGLVPARQRRLGLDHGIAA